MKKTDIHCHVLPGLDDGSDSWQESLQMIRMAAEQGFRAVTATPHYSRRFPNDCPDKIRWMCQELNRLIRRELNADIRVYPGQEIFYREEVPKKLKRGELLTIAESSYVLVEFLPEVPYSSLFRGLEQLILHGYRPILAHVERYGVLRKEGRIEELFDYGVVLQMNYHSIGGSWFAENTQWCRKMLKAEKIHLLGTDMHNRTTRAPATEKAEQWMRRHLNWQYIQKIAYKNARLVLTNEKL